MRYKGIFIRNIVFLLIVVILGWLLNSLVSNPDSFIYDINSFLFFFIILLLYIGIILNFLATFSIYINRKNNELKYLILISLFSSLYFTYVVIITIIKITNITV